MQETYKERLKELHGRGLSNRQIAKETGYHWSTIADHLKKMGLTSNVNQRQRQPIDMVSDNEARCGRCSDVFPLSEFQYGRKGQKYEYRFSYCNGCRKKQTYLSLNDSVARFLSDRFSRSKRIAMKEGVPFSITKEEYLEIFHRQGGTCFYTDAPMGTAVGAGLSRDTLSIDKIVPSKGYVPGNVVLCTHRANTAKGDFTMSELEKWMPTWYKKVVELWRALGLTCFQVAESPD